MEKPTSVICAFALTLLTSLTVLADRPAPNLRVARAILSVNLNNGQSLSVRRSLNDLHQGDLVRRLSVYTRANQPGAYLEVLIDNRPEFILEASQQIVAFDILLNMVNGVDYQNISLRAVGSVYVDSIEAYIAVTSAPPLEPVPPGPQPPPLEPVPPYPGNPNPPVNPPTNGSLAGSCADPGNQQFYAARNFANAAVGLYLDPQRAHQWALDYNRTHACGTIGEYQNRFEALKQLAGSRTGLNMAPAQAVQFALAKVETTTAEKTRELGVTLNAIREFGSRSLGLQPAATAQLGYEWILRPNCENEAGISRLAGTFSTDYYYARSANGLGYDHFRARDYALVRVRGLSRCGDLLR